MGLSTAERNRRKRERKKKLRDEERKQQQQQQQAEKTSSKSEVIQQATAGGYKNDDNNDDVEIEYIAPVELPKIAEDGDQPVPEAIEEVVRRFQARAALVDTASSAIVTDAEDGSNNNRKMKKEEIDDDNEYDDNGMILSKRKLREMLRPTVAELKRNVERPDLVEAHDITATEPEFLIQLKSIPGTVPVPRHWGRKRKYLQGKRGYEKPPFRLPEFLINTGITELRDTVMQNENEMSAKQKNRMRVQVKLGAIDVDYKTLHDAFFKYQTKPTTMTSFGDLYYEGKELEVMSKNRAGKPLSNTLRVALGMSSETTPPPWLLNMQRYGPPPTYTQLKIPGLNAPLPTSECQYGYHPGGWGKPPIDQYGRPLYGGNPFDPPGSSKADDNNTDITKHGGILVTSNGKTLETRPWGALPTGVLGGGGEEEEDHDDEEESSSDEEMEESSAEEEEEGEETTTNDGIASTMPPPSIPVTTAPIDLRKTGTETPLTTTQQPAKQLYTVIEQKAVTTQQSNNNAVFASEIAYAVPTTTTTTTTTDGAESVLTKAVKEEKRKTKDHDDDDDDNLGKNFKF